jgi:hypothetical protein
MKKLTKAVLAILVVASSITACKKGEGDPAISLRSRAARVAGEWTIDSQEIKSDYTNTSAGGSSFSGTSTAKFTATTYSGTNSQTATSAGNPTITTTTTQTGTVSANTYTFEKEGTYTSQKDYTVKSTQTQTPFTGYTITSDVTTVYSTSEEGVWNFLGKVQADTKNKEEMSLSTTKMTYTTTRTTVTTVTQTGLSPEITTIVDTDTQTSNDEPNSNVMIWKITTLKNKEMVVEAIGKTTTSGSNTETETTPTGTISSTTTSSGSSNYTTTINFVQN